MPLTVSKKILNRQLLSIFILFVEYIWAGNEKGAGFILAKIAARVAIEFRAA